MSAAKPLNSPLLNNRYQILQTIGAGGFGETFLAEDTHLPSRRRCVVKHLIPVSNTPQYAQLVQQRFEREAVILEQLGEEQPQIPDLFAYFESGGHYYLVQEWIEGITLTKKVETEGVLPETAVREILISILPVLEYVHSRQMVHRDIKPDNIILRKRDGKPVLIDFGAVKEAMGTAAVNSGKAQTVVIGTPGYMPSEQAAGRPTYSSDLYALGLTAIYLLTGKEPQELTTDPRTSEILWRQAAPSVSAELAGVIDRAIRYHPGDRFPSAQAMLSALQPATAPAATIPSPAPSAPAPTPAPASVTTATQIVSPRPTPAPAPTPAFTPAQSLPQATAQAAPVIRSPRQGFSVFKFVGGIVALGIGILLFGTLRNSLSESSRSSIRPSAPEATPESSPSIASSPQSEAGESPSDTSPRRIGIPPIFQPSGAGNGSSDRSTSQAIGFPVGTSERDVREALGEPTATTKGYWRNTRAVRYEDYLPGQVTLGFLFDNDTEKVRQTEAAFAQSVTSETMLQTLAQMLDGNVPEAVQQGLQRVYDRQTNQYEFTTGNLKGIIERNQRDRIYIGVWEADLH